MRCVNVNGIRILIVMAIVMAVMRDVHHVRLLNDFTISCNCFFVHERILDMALYANLNILIGFSFNGHCFSVHFSRLRTLNAGNYLSGSLSRHQKAYKMSFNTKAWKHHSYTQYGVDNSI